MCTHVFISLGYIPRCGIAGVYSFLRRVFLFSSYLAISVDFGVEGEVMMYPLSMVGVVFFVDGTVVEGSCYLCPQVVWIVEHSVVQCYMKT